MNKITDIGSRSSKTFFQSLIAAIIIEAVAVFFITYNNLYAFDFTDIYTWIYFVGVVLAIGILASSISAIQNAAINSRRKHRAEKKGGKK